MADTPIPTGSEVCLVVPAGSFDVGPIVAAIRGQHPELGIRAVWGGDPHHRPALPSGVGWADLDLDEPSGAGWGRLLVALPDRAYEWARAYGTVARRVASGVPSVLVLRVGSTAVVGPLDAWFPASGVTAIERSPVPLPTDGLAPSDHDLVRRGRWSVAALGVAADAVDALAEFARLVTAVRPTDDIGALLQLSLDRFADTVASPTNGVAVGWRASSDSSGSIAIVDVDDLDRDEPWHVTFDGRRPRRMLSDDVALADAVAASTAQWAGLAAPIVLPGGVAVDEPIRSLMSEALDASRRGGDDLPPDPYGPDGLLGWLEEGGPRSGGSIGRYWFEEWLRRPDLHIAFPDPMGDDRARFEAWAEASWRSDGRSALIRPAPDTAKTEWFDTGHLPGINVIGYVASDSGLGDFTRRVYRSLDDAGVATSALHYHRTASPIAEGVPPLTTNVEHDTNLITVHSDHMGFFADDHGAAVFPGRTNIGYWFWELSELSPRSVAAVRFVDEVWAATTFIRDAYRCVTDKPVRVVPIPVPEPQVSNASRASLGLPDDRFVFLVTLDHLSITDRKNPMGAVRAFERAFPEPTPGGPVLVVKTLNGSQRWAEHEELQVAAARRPDITVVDRHLSRADQMRLIELGDCLVSLHRSEGLGLHLMEAMWLGTPVIGTRYSGNLDFMSDDNSILIDADLIPVTDRQGYYPTTAVWADPDLDAAAAAMRLVFEDEARREQLTAAARRDMMNQPSMAQTGHLIARLCREAEPTSKE